MIAQRRPGPKPRRHRGGSQMGNTPTGRSTKAGAETPATLLIQWGRGILPHVDQKTEPLRTNSQNWANCSRRLPFHDEKGSLEGSHEPVEQVGSCGKRNFRGALGKKQGECSSALRSYTKTHRSNNKNRNPGACWAICRENHRRFAWVRPSRAHQALFAEGGQGGWQTFRCCQGNGTK